MSKKILILGVNGFIGNALTERILNTTDWSVYGMDMDTHKINHLLDNDRFHFIEGDILINKEWIAYHIKKCDVILPLVAIATPATYVQKPLSVFELDFEANLEIVRQCVQYNKRVLFPSTSEVYGMCQDKQFDEETSTLVQGPINKPRWIYSTSKQLMDRVIFAYGQEKGLKFTLFRPFNWVGPKLDNVFEPKEGGSRVVTQFISNILHGKDINLVGGGKQRRSFTDIEDGIGALMKIIENKDGCADGRIFNIGNPDSDYSIRELAEMILAQVQHYPNYAEQAKKTNLVDVDAAKYYGEGYQDVDARVPSIENAKKYLDWAPTIDLATSLKRTLDFHLAEPKELNEASTTETA
ncbi:MAG: NAD-dependent dehydratase [marine bacterium B5-7]|nr:MAG: NAD-dependent dehydratase [marine bacterium B5-7]